MKCTKSTAGSAFNILRRVRRPGPGSPETNITRIRSRTPFIEATERLFSRVNSESPGSTSNSNAIRPSRSNTTSISVGLPILTEVVDCSFPSMLSLTGTNSPRALESSTRTKTFTVSPITEYFGASSMMSRRSSSVASPVNSTWIGPAYSICSEFFGTS